MKEKATIYDLERMCKAFRKDFCKSCPLSNVENNNGIACGTFVRYCADKANEIILKWCKEHPVETRQDRFLKVFPKMKVDNDGVSVCCPKWADKDFKCDMKDLTCDECRKEFWLTEVYENE